MEEGNLLRPNFIVVYDALAEGGDRLSVEVLSVSRLGGHKTDVHKYFESVNLVDIPGLRYLLSPQLL